MASHSDHILVIIELALLFFFVAGIAVPFLQRFKISSILTYLLCGIIIGPYGLARFTQESPWLEHVSINDTSVVATLGEFGIITLMFMIGLELSFRRLKELKRFILGLGSLQILVTAFLIGTIAYLFDNSLEMSILLGASLALSSTAIVMRFLEEQKMSRKPTGILCFSILLMQDIAVVPILILVTSFASVGQGSLITLMIEAVAIGCFAIASIYFLGRYILGRLFRYISQSSSDEWLLALIVFVVLLFSALTHSAGLSFALGAFMAGLLIAETEFKHQVEILIAPLKGFLMGLFFLSIGMIVDVSKIIAYPVLLPLSVIGLYVLKATVIFFLSLAFTMSGKRSVEAAVYLSQPGEFALLILGLAISTQLIPISEGQFFLLVVIISMMLAPLVFKLAPFFGRLGDKLFLRAPFHDHHSGEPISESYNVVVAGFGRIGRSIVDTMIDKNITYIAVDSNGEKVQRARHEGYNVIYGDIREPRLWSHLVHNDVRMAIIAIDDHASVFDILKFFKNNKPDLSVIVRSKDDADLAVLYDCGAKYIIEETREASRRIAEIALKELT